MTPQGTMGWECKQTSWCADRRHRLVWRARRIFFKTYLKWNEMKWNGPGFRGVTPCKDESIHINLENSQDSVTICQQPHLFFSTLCLTRSADPNEPLPICSNTSYCSIPVDCGAPGSEITCRAEDALKRNRKNSVKGVKLSNECTCSEFKREVIRRTYPKQIKNRFKFGKYAFFF